MEPEALPAWAEEHAAKLLADCARAGSTSARSPGRHSASVRRLMRLLARTWSLLAGCTTSATRRHWRPPPSHPLDGVRHVRSVGQERLARLLADHSSARWEAEALGLSDDLAAFPREDSATADAVTYCDMTASPTGGCITLADRLAEIDERYGPEHLVVRCLQRAHDHLAGAVQRTDERLWAAGVPD